MHLASVVGMTFPRIVRAFAALGLLASTLASAGCDALTAYPCETREPQERATEGVVSYAVPELGPTSVELADLDELNALGSYVLDVQGGASFGWVHPGSSVTASVRLGPLTEGTMALADVGARFCTGEVGAVADDCEELEGTLTVASLRDGCADDDDALDCVESVALTIDVPASETDRFAGHVELRSSWIAVEGECHRSIY